MVGYIHTAHSVPDGTLYEHDNLCADRRVKHLLHVHVQNYEPTSSTDFKGNVTATSSILMLSSSLMCFKSFLVAPMYTLNDHIKFQGRMILYYKPEIALYIGPV